MFPSEGVIVSVLGSQHPTFANNKSKVQPERSVTPFKREPFPAWSAVEEVKEKADAFGREAAKEYDIASHKAQDATGHIEPFTPKYYASCIFGGLLACVSWRPLLNVDFDFLSGLLSINGMDHYVPCRA